MFAAINCKTNYIDRYDRYNNTTKEGMKTP